MNGIMLRIRVAVYLFILNTNRLCSINSQNIDPFTMRRVVWFFLQLKRWALNDSRYMHEFTLTMSTFHFLRA